MNPDESFQDDTITSSTHGPILNLIQSSSTITPLEHEVLQEYTRLLQNINQLTATLQGLSAGPMTVQIAESLRVLERRVASVYTLMKASVYSIVLQQGEGIDGHEET